MLCTTWQKYLEFSVWLQKPVIEVFSPLVFVCLSLLQKYIYLVSFAFICLIAFTQRQVSWIHKNKVETFFIAFRNLHLIAILLFFWKFNLLHYLIKSSNKNRIRLILCSDKQQIRNRYMAGEPGRKRFLCFLS